MQPKTRWLTGAVAADALIGVGTGAAVAATSGDDEEPLTGSNLDKATAAALEETGGGTVVETEGGDDGAAYSVEVRLDDGTRKRSISTRTSTSLVMRPTTTVPTTARTTTEFCTAPRSLTTR